MTDETPLRPGVRYIGSDTREPAEQAREASGLTRGLDASNAEEWRAMALRLADALRSVRRMADASAMDARDPIAWENVIDTIDDALAAEDLLAPKRSKGVGDG